MKKTVVFLVVLFFSLQNNYAQVVLEANGKGDTYALINSVLSPGYDGIEAPDCSHPSFGNHIDEIFDKELNKYVFRFSIHVTPDNDRCKNFDRQRNEIKTYTQSPANLLAIEGEKVVYKWKFKLPENFSSSTGFTHIHQIKAIGGPEEGMPLFTLSTRSGSQDQLELRYGENTSQTTLKKTDLTPFKNTWVEVTEIIEFGDQKTGKYTITITKISNGEVLFHYNNNALRTWKTNAEVIRPKWGIYRSLKDSSSLRDEELLFADFSIEEISN
jgi:hypothetical protein